MPISKFPDEQALALIEELPVAQRQRVMARFARKECSRKRPRFGSGKDDILYIAEDFDAPLDDFKEYEESASFAEAMRKSGPSRLSHEPLRLKGRGRMVQIR